MSLIFQSNNLHSLLCSLYQYVSWYSQNSENVTIVSFNSLTFVILLTFCHSQLFILYYVLSFVHDSIPHILSNTYLKSLFRKMLTIRVLNQLGYSITDNFT